MEERFKYYSRERKAVKHLTLLLSAVACVQESPVCRSHLCAGVTCVREFPVCRSYLCVGVTYV